MPNALRAVASITALFSGMSLFWGVARYFVEGPADATPSIAWGVSGLLSALLLASFARLLDDVRVIALKMPAAPAPARALDAPEVQPPVDVPPLPLVEEAFVARERQRRLET